MKLLESKIAMEQYLSNNYNETTVHWAGMKFNTLQYDEWVYFEYIVNGLYDCGLDNTVYEQKGALHVAVVSPTPFRCSQIGDIVLDMFKGKEISGLKAREVTVLSTDYASDIEKTVLEFEIKFSNI